jgi:hypothetical protein
MQSPGDLIRFRNDSRKIEKARSTALCSMQPERRVPKADGPHLNDLKGFKKNVPLSA